ncbi:MAG TPA: hypothetical protein VLA83_14460, partial [Candidatus Binatia bacterium]|nr:hypothetical protein [Candidatus Binatia bacterium]
MPHARISVLLLLFAVTLCAAGKDKEKEKEKEDWLPVTQQDLAIKEVPHDPGASAIQLYLSYYKDDDAKFLSVYRRIKVLNEAGKKRADVNIEIEPGESLKELAARTIHPDQRIIDYTGKPLEKLLIKR